MAVFKIRTVAEADKEARRQTYIIITLSAICLFGFSYVIYDYLQITDRIAMPERLSEVDTVVRQLETRGLVVSLSIPDAKLVVSDQEWGDLSYEEKVGLITQLGRYCADKNKSNLWTLTVIGNRSTAKLGELGLVGLIVN